MPQWTNRSKPSEPDFGQQPDYYRVLGLSPPFSPADLKAAYHRALLRFHPDKRQEKEQRDVDVSSTVAEIKDAYMTLSSPALRAAYDAQLERRQAGPRPAQVVSLEEFSESEEDNIGRWTYDCRCGGVYVITEREMEEDRHLVGCGSCSEVIWVGYEIAEGEDVGSEGKQ
ncbi:DnaJ-domain-containing protein [Gloeophyllum trabeum ATCC 11539]|uniref:Diphthamide biosynthesis protein 4 n=1 Tax=Gloeophyllum trabeum (strain ATCC 11539 / FP-39264 / Madison 617) TaxID=670483 RepID=S7S2L5_GLOTA|nr:DnaJ-domain-containing protein [Gloeophyllum trabeum ATCC 11539]EPQ59994.1 DnaJ-domain-containing protein [Gloeophyllum trabeum ATCC 11539]